MKAFAGVVLAETGDVWNAWLGEGGYREPSPVLFSGAVQSACGRASASARLTSGRPLRADRDARPP